MPKTESKPRNHMTDGLAVIHDLSLSIGASLNLEKEMASFLRGLADTFSCDRASFHLLKAGELSTEASYGLSQKEREQESRSPLRSPLLQEVLSKGEPVNLFDPALTRYQSQFVAPLRQRGAFLGALWLARTKPVPFTEQDVTIIQLLADRFSISMDRALLYQELERKNEHLQKLNSQLIKVKADWQSTFDSISDLICILDRDARIMRVNRAFSARLKKPYDKLLGVACHEVIHGSASPPLHCPFHRVMQSGKPVEQDVEVKMGDALFAASLFPFFDSQGILQGAVHVFRDITEQKNLKDRLFQSEKMAAIGKLAAEIAHEINNPLDYINNYLFLLSDSLPPDFDKHEYLKKMEAGIDNLAALTRDLLEFSRPQIDVFAPLDVHKVIDSSLEFAGKYIHDKRVEVTKNYGCQAGPVVGSERMLQQVLLNLTLNALDAMPAGGRITIATSCRPGQSVIEFGDTGAGIPGEHIQRIFDPFFTTKKTHEKRGTGLGLTICYNIISQHGGDMRVSSRVGEGTTFTILLPLSDTNAQAEGGHAT
jgi:two-component system NtrC family sensor kinase